MKFLKLCLWCCLAMSGVSAVCAQTFAPDQERQMTDALRKALDQAQPSFDSKAVERARIEVRAKQAEMEKLFAQERSAVEAQRRSEISRVNAEAAGAVADVQARREAENRAKADMKAKAEAEARRILEEQRLAAARTPAPAALPPAQESVARAALRTDLERAEVAEHAASRVTDRVAAAAPPSAEGANAPVVAQTPATVGESQLPPEQDSAAREALRKALEQSPTAAPGVKPAPSSDVDPSKVERDRIRAEAESRARAKREADRIMAERARRSEETGRVPAPAPAASSATPSAASSGDDAAIREALRRALEDAEKMPAPAKPAAQPPPAETPKPAPRTATAPPPAPVPAEPARPPQTPAAPAAPVQTPAVAATPAPAETLSITDDVALREALRKTMEEREAAAAAAVPPPAKAQKGKETSATPTKESTAPVLSSPAGPKSKAQRLAELTEAYRRDEITPAQYHQERAKILAEPNEKQ